MLTITDSARAYVNLGRWVADCPKECGYALALSPRQGMFHCGECQHLCSVAWPHNADQIWEALAVRELPINRNWFPAGHDLAVRAGLPEGQSVKDLNEETAEHQGGI